MSNEKLMKLIGRFDEIDSLLYKDSGGAMYYFQAINLVNEISAMRHNDEVDFTIAVPVLINRLGFVVYRNELDALRSSIEEAVRDERYTGFTMDTIIENLTPDRLPEAKQLSEVLIILAVQGFDITPVFPKILELMEDRRTISFSLDVLEKIGKEFISEDHVKLLREKMKEILRNEKNERRKLKLKIEFARLYDVYVQKLDKLSGTKDVKTLKLPPKDRGRFRIRRARCT